MPSSEFERGWYAGCRSLTECLFEEFKPRRKGAIASMDVIRFDSLVEKHLEHIKPIDTAEIPQPIIVGVDGRLWCPECRSQLHRTRTPERCPECLQALIREVKP
jgi:hypothetical protein